MYTDGISRVSDDEWQISPNDLKQWKDRLVIFRNNLLMVTACFQQFEVLHVTEKQLDDFYDHLYGPLLADRPSNPIPLKVLMAAEREAWKQVSIDAYEGKSIGTTLMELKANSLFWTTHTEGASKRPWSTAFESPAKSPRPTRNQRRGAATQRMWEAIGSTSKGTPSKGAGKQPRKGDKGQGKSGKGKGKQDKSSKGWPSKWAKTTPKGQKFCGAFHQHGNCRFGSQCRDSHNCPVMSADGWVCNKGDHKPDRCPLLSR